MVAEFNQKRGWSSRRFKLTYDKVIVETTTLSKIEKYEVRLFELGIDLHYQADNTIVARMALMVCILATAGTFFFLGTKAANIWIFNAFLFAFLACVAYFKKHQDDIILEGGSKKLVFYRAIPDEKTVLEFIDLIKEQKKINLIVEYTFFDENTNEEFYYERIEWLRYNRIISDEEFEEFKIKFDIQKLL